jgi:hypothetical protein
MFFHSEDRSNMGSMKRNGLSELLVEVKSK